VATSSLGRFEIDGVPGPAEYALVGFLDENGNNKPDGLEQTGWYGPAGTLAWYFKNAPVFHISSGTLNSGADVNLFDLGQATGTVNVGNLTGRLVVTVGHGDPQSGQFAEESSLDYDIQPGSSVIPYAVGTLLPATDYAVLAFVESSQNGNKKLDPDEPYGFSDGGLSIGANQTLNIDLAVNNGPGGPGISACRMGRTWTRGTWTTARAWIFLNGNIYAVSVSSEAGAIKGRIIRYSENGERLASAIIPMSILLM